MSMNVPEAINQLVSEGYSDDEAFEIVSLAIQKMNTQKQESINYSPLKQGVNDKSMAEYWKALREQAEKDVFIPPHMNVPSTQTEDFETFKQNMRNRNPKSESTLRNTASAIEWFKQQRKGS